MSRVLLTVFSCVCLGVIVGILAVVLVGGFYAPTTDQVTPAPSQKPWTKVHYENLDGHVIVTVQGGDYIAWRFFTGGDPADAEKNPFARIFFLELVKENDPHHQINEKISDAESVTLLNVTCQVEKRDARSFKKRLGQTFDLVEGPEAEHGEKLSVHGYFQWSKKDGQQVTFSEPLQSGENRVWKSRVEKPKDPR